MTQRPVLKWSGHGNAPKLILDLAVGDMSPSETTATYGKTGSRGQNMSCCITLPSTTPVRLTPCPASSKGRSWPPRSVKVRSFVVPLGLQTAITVSPSTTILSMLKLKVVVHLTVLCHVVRECVDAGEPF